MDAHDLFVSRSGRWTGAVAALYRYEPFLEPGTNRSRRRSQVDPFCMVCPKSVALCDHLPLGACIDGLAPATSVNPSEVDHRDPHTVTPTEDSSLTLRTAPTGAH